MSDVGEVANAVGTVATLLKPLIDDAVAHKYDAAYEKTLAQWSDACIGLRSDDLWTILLRLCNATGHPTAPIRSVGTCLAIPEELLFQLGVICADHVRLQALVTELINSKKT